MRIITFDDSSLILAAARINCVCLSRASVRIVEDRSTGRKLRLKYPSTQYIFFGGCRSRNQSHRYFRTASLSSKHQKKVKNEARNGQFSLQDDILDLRSIISTLSYISLSSLSSIILFCVLCSSSRVPPFLSSLSSACQLTSTLLTYPFISPSAQLYTCISSHNTEILLSRIRLNLHCPATVVSPLGYRQSPSRLLCPYRDRHPSSIRLVPNCILSAYDYCPMELSR